nr:uncharacterized protein LOC111503967 [Leptinotarsa decemlineata]
MILAGIFYGFLSKEKLKPFILGIIFHFPSDAAFFTSVVYGHDVNEYKHMVFENCSCIDSGGHVIEKKIKNEIGWVMRLCFIPLFLSILMTISFLPFVGDEEIFLFQITIMKEWFGNWLVGLRFFVYLIFALLLGISGWIVGSTTIVTGYIIFHLKFQFILLDRHFEKLKSLVREKNEDIRQQEVRNGLKNFVENHLRIKNLYKLLFRRQDFYMIILTPPLILAVVAFVYFIKTEISPPSNFRMLIGLVTGAVTFCSHCINGQLLSDESSKLHEKLYSCDWIDWNESNKKSMMIILPAIKEPMKASCLGLVDLGHPYILFVSRAIYSLLAVAVTLL